MPDTERQHLHCSLIGITCSQAVIPLILPEKGKGKKTISNGLLEQSIQRLSESLQNQQEDDVSPLQGCRMRTDSGGEPSSVVDLVDPSSRQMPEVLLCVYVCVCVCVCACAHCFRMCTVFI